MATTCSCAGNPKGVVLTHENIVTAVASLHSYVHQQKIEIARDDSVLSFLTLAHILGRVVEEFAVSCGAKIGYWQVCLLEINMHPAAFFAFGLLRKFCAHLLF